MAADGRDLRIRCIARKRSAFAPTRTTLISGPHARSAQETPAMACVPSYEAPGTLNSLCMFTYAMRYGAADLCTLVQYCGNYGA